MAKKKTRTKKKTTRKTASARSGSGGGPAIGAASVADLERELAARKRGASKLLKRRDRLIAQLAEVDAELAGLGMSPNGSPSAGTGGAGTRPRNSKKLPDALAEVLTGREMSVTEAAEAVQRAGYRTSSSNFRTIVNQCLLRENKLFKKVSRGVYTAK